MYYNLKFKNYGIYIRYRDGDFNTTTVLYLSLFNNFKITTSNLAGYLIL